MLLSFKYMRVSWHCYPSNKVHIAKSTIFLKLMKHVHGREGCQLLETENLIHVHVIIHNQMQDPSSAHLAYS